MTWFPFYTADFLGATIGLSFLERAAYAVMLVMYYELERPLPLDRTRCFRLLQAESDEQRRAIDHILQEFFVRRDDGWYNERAEAEIAKSSVISKKRAASGLKGAKARWNKDMGMASAKHLLDNCIANATTPTPTPTGTPTGTSKDTQPTAESPRLPAADPVPYQQIVDLYHAKLPMLPRVAKLTDGRRAAIRSRWRLGELPDLETWGRFFDDVAASPFLTGRVQPGPGRKVFMADLEWLVKEANFIKVWEGRYA